MSSLFRNLSVRAKLFGSAALLLACIVISSVLSIVNLGAVNKNGTDMYKNAVVPLRDASAAAYALQDEQRLVLRGIVSHGQAAVQSTLIDPGIQADDATIQHNIGEYAATVSSGSAEARELAGFRQAYGTYVPLREQVRKTTLADDPKTAAALNLQSVTSFNAAETALKSIVSINDGKASAGMHQIGSTYSSSRTLTLIVLALALAIGIAVAFLVSQYIVHRVRGNLRCLNSLESQDVAALADGLTAFADGDLTRELKSVSEPIVNPPKDELGQVGRAANKVRERILGAIDSYNSTAVKLRELVGQVAGAATNVNAASQEMASTSDETGRVVGEIAHATSDLATGAERQVRMVDSARLSADEVVTGIQATARAAQETAAVADQAREVAQEGAGAAESATEAMHAVRDSSQQVTSAIRALAAKSEQIGAIVETITGIAAQTNLLALNAAIEAARAGEQGRGFAVVAEEVRKLAEGSKDAAEEIGGLIRAIQDETSKAVDVVEDGSRRTEQGATTVEQTRDAFLRIGAAVEDMTQRIEQIAAAAQQMSAGATQLQQNIVEVAAVAEQSSASTEQVSASTEETSASSQEIAASAQELASSAEELSRLVNQFKL